MIAEDIVGKIRENCQIFYDEPLLDGFPDDVPVRQSSTKILDWANVAYTTDLVLEGIFQCWHALIMTTGKVAYKYSGMFGYIHQMFLKGTDGQTYDLDPITPPRERGDPFYRGRTSGRPDAVELLGSHLVFNKTPDAAYTAYFLADTTPTPMVQRTDTPRALDLMNHMAVVAGGSFYISRMALGSPQMNDYKFRRYGEIKAEWDMRKKYALDTATARAIYQGTAPMVTDYRKRNTRIR